MPGAGEISMNVFSLAFFALLIPAQTLAAESRSLVFLFGPTTEDHGTAAAQAAAGLAKHWLETPMSTAELRFAGSSDRQEFFRAMAATDIEKTLAFAAQDGRQSGLKGLLNGFDRAGYTARRHEGGRLLIAILDPAALDADAESRLAATADFCKENSIRVILFDASGSAAKDAPAALAALATGTGGAILHEAGALEKTVDSLFPAPAAEAAAAPKAKEGAGALTIGTKFLRTLSARVVSTGSGFAITHGFLIAQTPLNTLEFATAGGSYLARARVSLLVRNAGGKSVWQARKDVQIKGPVARLSARRTGQLTYMRELQLPAGTYTVEASVEDQTSGKSAGTSQPLAAADTVPGFNVSDAILVRPFDGSIDQFESDTVFAFDGKALAPLLDPPLQAGNPFELRMYLVLYPDLRGGQPDLNLDILSGGQAVAHSQLRMGDKIRNNATEGSALDAKGDQREEFPYLADIPGITLDAGEYEARITVRQDKRTITRSVAFRVSPK